MTGKQLPGKQGRKKEDKENYEGIQRGTVGGVEAGCGQGGRGSPYGGKGRASQVEMVARSDWNARSTWACSR